MPIFLKIRLNDNFLVSKNVQESLDKFMHLKKLTVHVFCARFDRV